MNRSAATRSVLVGKFVNKKLLFSAVVGGLMFLFSRLEVVLDFITHRVSQEIFLLVKIATLYLFVT